MGGEGGTGAAPAGPAPLAQRLREAAGDALPRLLREEAEGVGAPEALQALANPHLDREGVEALGARRDLLVSYEVRKAVALHPAAPEVLARRLLGGLYWRDLVAAGADMRMRPTLRRAADQLLGERLAGMSLGEKVAIARRAGLGLVQRLRDDPNPRVMAALLDNPRLTEGALLPVLARERTAPPVLAAVADDRRWGVRYPIRAALARNPATPVQVALRLLPHLRKPDQGAVARDLRIAAPVRRRARLLLGEG
jgi:hypothetical protein